MLKKFKSLSGLHGLEDFDWSGGDLQQYSLIYGWNGSGKTTMSNVLYCLKQGQVAVSDFDDVCFRIETNPSGYINQTKLDTHTLNLEVFNQQFINKNVDFDTSGAEPIVMIGDENIKLLGEIKTEQDELDKKLEELEKLKNERKKLPDTDNILTDAGRSWRMIASELSISGDRYFGSGFNIASVRELLKNKDISVDNIDGLRIDAEDEANRRQSVKNDWESIDDVNVEQFDLKELFMHANQMLQTVIKVTKLPDVEVLEHALQAWIEQGLSMHENMEQCAFCTNTLPSDRLENLRAQFTNSLNEANAELEDLLMQIDTLETDRLDIDSSALLPSLRDEFSSQKKELNDKLVALSKNLASLRQDLVDKKKHLTDSSTTYQTHAYPEKTILEVNVVEAKIAKLIRTHNSKVENIGTENNGHLRVLMLNCIANHLKSKEYFTTLERKEKLDDQIKKLSTATSEALTNLNDKKASLNDQKLAVEKINGLLSNFFENNKLCFKPIVKNEVTTYEIHRRGRKAQNLSEGEKSVLALAYFLVSLKAMGSSELSKTIVVIDDPVDSQDGNFLFRTYGVIRRSLKDAQQVVILTHNFEFFSIVKDWFSSVSESPALLLVSREAMNDEAERMRVTDLPTLLRDYKTEYHYLFYRLFGYVHLSDKLDPPLVANVARKVLEYFSSFKWCCRSSEDFASRVQSRFMGENATPEERAIGDAIYKFVNEYSHAQDPFRPIGMAGQEAESIALNTLKFISMADRDHYNSLKRQCNREAQT